MNKEDIKDLRQHWRYILKDCPPLADWLKELAAESGVVKHKNKISKRSKNYFDKINYKKMVESMMDCGITNHQIKSCIEKTMYNSLDEALACATKYHQSIYPCDYCKKYHLTSH